MFKSGFVNIIGKPNAGKSTLINAIIGEKLSIVTPKIQTTRHRILGILTKDDFQMVFSDTPGIIKDPKYLLQEKMMNFVKTAIDDADVILQVSEFDEPMSYIRELYEELNSRGVPVLLCINKIDKASSQEEVVDLVEKLSEFCPKENIVPVSAIMKFNTESVVIAALDHLQEGEPFFDEEQYTDKTERFIISEMVREKMFYLYRQEIPYSVEVVVTSFKDEEKMLSVAIEIYANRDSQKPILIGRGGEMLKKLGTQVREELEKLYEKKVFLETYVRVKEDWRENKNFLREHGYDK